MKLDNVKVSPLLLSSIALVPLKLLSYFIVNPFLAFTTVFPLILLIQDEISVSLYYTKTLSWIAHTLFQTDLNNITTGQLLGIFFLLIAILGLILDGIRYLLRKNRFGNFTIKLSYILLGMTVIYIVAAVKTYILLREDAGLSLILVFYLYSIFSNVAYWAINKATVEIHQKTAS